MSDITKSNIKNTFTRFDVERCKIDKDIFKKQIVKILKNDKFKSIVNSYIKNENMDLSDISMINGTSERFQYTERIDVKPNEKIYIDNDVIYDIETFIQYQNKEISLSEIRSHLNKFTEICGNMINIDFSATYYNSNSLYVRNLNIGLFLDNNSECIIFKISRRIISDSLAERKIEMLLKCLEDNFKYYMIKE